MPSKVPICVVLGGGGHARVLIDALRLSGAATLRAVLDADPVLWGQELLGVPIIGGDALLPNLRDQGVTHFVVGLGGIGDNRPRQRLFEAAFRQGLAPLSVRHPAASCSAWATIGPGSVLFPQAVVNAGAVLGANVIVNTGAIVEHDCIVGDHAHIASGATLASTVRVGVAAHIGAGATVRQCLTVGENAVVGAGAVVIRDVAARRTVIGVPAAPLRSKATGHRERRAAGVT